MVKEKKAVKKETVKKEVVETATEKKKVEKKKVEKKSTKKVESKNKEKKTNVNKTTLKSEFNKIKWPTKKEMVKYSVATILFIVFFALFFEIIQLIMAALKNLL